MKPNATSHCDWVQPPGSLFGFACQKAQCSIWRWSRTESCVSRGEGIFIHHNSWERKEMVWEGVKKLRCRRRALGEPTRSLPGPLCSSPQPGLPVLSQAPQHGGWGQRRRDPAPKLSAPSCEVCSWALAALGVSCCSLPREVSCSPRGAFCPASPGNG